MCTYVLDDPINYYVARWDAFGETWPASFGVVDESKHRENTLISKGEKPVSFCSSQQQLGSFLLWYCCYNTDSLLLFPCRIGIQSLPLLPWTAIPGTS